MIGDFERISDHAVNLLESVEELENKGLAFTAPAVSELETLSSAVNEILDLSLTAFLADISKLSGFDVLLVRAKREQRYGVTPYLKTFSYIVLELLTEHLL